MKTNALLSSPILLDEFPAATLAPIACAAEPKLQCLQKPAPQIRIGMVLAGSDRTVWWEQLAFIILWLCGLLSVVYCLKTVLSLPWPG